MVIADTGFWLALCNPKDHVHRHAQAARSALRERLVTTWPVLTETCHLLVERLHPQAATRFMAGLADSAVDLFELSPAHLPRIGALMRKYEALPMDLADASLVLLAEKLGHGRILTTDQRDFGAYRWKHNKPFQNLLELN